MAMLDRKKIGGLELALSRLFRGPDRESAPRPAP